MTPYSKNTKHTLAPPLTLNVASLFVGVEAADDLHTRSAPAQNDVNVFITSGRPFCMKACPRKRSAGILVIAKLAHFVWAVVHLCLTPAMLVEVITTVATL